MRNYGSLKLKKIQSVRTLIPTSLYEILQAKRFETNMPIARLIAYAIDKELDCVNPFSYPCEMPTTEFIQYQHSNEAGKIIKHLTEFPKGSSLDFLVLKRRDIGISDKNKFLHGIRELQIANLLEEIIPSNKWYKYPDDYRNLRLKI